jgi:nucleoside-diphosphate-sugar epimerase
MKFTVLGSTGFIGSRVAALARTQGHEVICPGRNESLQGRELGHVIYAIGITADFRSRPHETITAHITKLQDVLTQSSFESLVYLSSTRVYARCTPISESLDTACAAAETMPVPVVSSDFSDLYNLSKLMGESIALAHGSNVRVARLSNVVGPDFDSENFLTSILRDCVQTGRVTLRSSLDSAKDYVSVDDVASVLLRLGQEGRSPIYNVASGCQTTNGEIVEALLQLTNATFCVAPGSPTFRFPAIDISRLKTELGFAPQRMDAILPPLAEEFHQHFVPPVGKEVA